MAIKFQYNKTSLGELDKQLKMRVKALPTIKSKESALRVEVKKAREQADGYGRQLDALVGEWDYMAALWGEFDADIVRVSEVDEGVQKIAGVAIPVLREVGFDRKQYDLFSAPMWFADGVALLERLARLGLEHDFAERKARLLDGARKRTTQKVNLYEKVQIPGYQEAILKIKRFLEDEENLSKSSQKIVKARRKRDAGEEVRP
jgi:V/A-type H+-transporting ATPase subunit D